MDESTENQLEDLTLSFSENPERSMPEASNFLTGLQEDAAAGKSVFENYKIIDELPRGGQAAVYKATHVPTQTTVAIKVLLPTLLASARARYYFERESRLIARLEHPNIVRIRDSGIIQGQYFFVMEYIQGKGLKQFAQGLPRRQQVQLFVKICSAVQYAHQQGIIHRDLKFANIIVDTHGEPHILDFGLAKALDLAEEDEKHGMATVTGQWAGSLSNMSPEQAAGKPDLIDMRTDIYALGMILYYLLLGPGQTAVDRPASGFGPGSDPSQVDHQKSRAALPVGVRTVERPGKLASGTAGQRQIAQHPLPAAKNHETP
jgi:serine/threonine protein kinase